MPAAQAAVARQNRLAETSRQMHADMQSALAARREREERRVADAISSSRMTNAAVAQACLAWLVQRGEVGRDWTVETLAEAVLYFLAVDHDGGGAGDSAGAGAVDGQEKDSGNEATQKDDNDKPGSEPSQIISILDAWTAWSTTGGMKPEQVQFLESRKVEFCLAASLVAVIQKSEAAGQGKSSADMMECLGLWRKVRLG